LDENLEAKIQRLIDRWREEHQDAHTPDAEIVRQILDGMGILPGAKVEVANNKSGDGELVVKISFHIPKPLEFFDISVVTEERKKNGKKKRRLR
jgi:hypothetical protein